MALASGSSLGPYEILGLAGAGGMGEVYRARDPRLGRDVAIKVLPPGLSADADRLRRFEQEARAAAALSHPNILAVYDIGQHDGSPYIVSEFLDGHTLRARLPHRRPSDNQSRTAKDERESLPLRKAIDYAVQIARGLAAAHDKGIVHRDLKPDNIFITSDGRVKILDFGLAKLTQPEVAATASSAVAATGIPTESHDTAPGIVLGTMGYMSPEQVRGLPADHRSDIFAFGAVLYEMVAGQRAFQGDTSADTLTAILKEDPPDLTGSNRHVPPALVRIIDRCLEKSPAARFRSADDLAFALEALSAHSGATEAVASVSPPRRRAWLAWLVATAALIAAVATVLILWAPRGTTPAPAPLRVVAELGVDASVLPNMVAQGVLSPNGTILAFVAQKANADQRMLYIRHLEEQLEATVLTGTEDARGPFFSPDGQQIGFFAGGKLKKVAVSGGGAIEVCSAADDRGGTWADDDTIVFTNGVQGNAGEPGLLKVRSAGGTPTTLTTLAKGEVTHRWPQALPGGKGILFTAHSSNAGFDDGSIVVRTPAGELRLVQRGGYYGRYLSSGHLVFMHDGRLFAAPFDLDTLMTTSPPVPVVESVRTNPNVGAPTLLDVSKTGTLVYVPGASVNLDAQVHWLTQDGKITTLQTAKTNWSNPVFEPQKGDSIAFDVSDGKQLDIWTYDWRSNTPSQLTFDPADDRRPVYTPDGKRIVFASNRGGNGAINLYWQRADHTGGVQQLTQSPLNQLPGSFDPTGKFLAYQEFGGQTLSDILILPIEGTEASGWKPGTPRVFLNTRADESEPMISNDGRWLAYRSSEQQGRPQIFVRSFPSRDGPWKVSEDGGGMAMWSRKANELFFVAPNAFRVMVASYTVEGNAFRRDKPRTWSETTIGTRPRQRFVALHPDGRRLAIATPAEAISDRNGLIIWSNWFEKLRQAVH